MLQACSQELWQLFMCQFEALRGRTDTPLLDEALTQIYQVKGPSLPGMSLHEAACMPLPSQSKVQNAVMLSCQGLCWACQ